MLTACLTLCIVSVLPADDDPEPRVMLRIATFNASLNRNEPGELERELSTPDDPQLRNVAEIIQRVRPDILLINEFDYDDMDASIERFRTNYLAIGQRGAEPIDYPFAYSAPVNTGVASGFDLDRDGQAVREIGSRGYGNDALGYGLFPGQYGMVVYSRFPIDREAVRSFGELLWKDMPGALLPETEDGEAWYAPEILDVLRLSSKSHWDVPIRVGDRTIHVLASHPTPPAFDGPEDRNGKRNHDEIRIWLDYLTGGPQAGYLGASLPSGTPFVILGDLNSDPADGGSRREAIQALLGHPRVDARVVPRSEGAIEASRLQGGANAGHRGDPAADTADFNDREPGNLRVDYVLPGGGLVPLGGGVFWPTRSDPLHRLVVMEPEAASSDHRLVYLDVAIMDVGVGTRPVEP